MQITYLGHAGFCVEMASTTIIMDPWLSRYGAFDSAWFQFPCNHHLADLVQQKVQDKSKERYIYISHEHKDHFDIEFLNSLIARDFTFLLPAFRRSALRDQLATSHSKGIVACHDGQAVPIGEGCVTLYLDDSELNRDSTILVKGDGCSFLNMNDCKLHDRLADIIMEHGSVDVFACQFSGATWHPTCYDYPEQTYREISRKKVISKFEATAKAIESIKPRIYLPSAGPCCFLDPLLLHINFQPLNIFPPAPRFLAYLERRLRRSHPVYAENVMPGDVLDVEKCEFVHRVSERVSEENFAEYITSYAAMYDDFFASRRYSHSGERLESIRDRLCQEFERKMAGFMSSEKVGRCLYMQFVDGPEWMIRVDFQRREVRPTTSVEEMDFYLISAPSWEIERVLDKKLTWEDFSLTFRMRLSRRPDLYQTLIQGFLIMEAEDLNYFCERLLEIQSRTERLIVEAGGCRYSINRFCPHQGADLGEGWIEDGRYLVCARHRWRFDLHGGGRCETSNTSIDAIALEDT
jgi:UDP-MurNAc hydroxylase